MSHEHRKPRPWQHRAGEAEGYPPEIMEKIYYKNAIRILDLDLDEASFG